MDWILTIDPDLLKKKFRLAAVHLLVLGLRVNVGHLFCMQRWVTDDVMFFIVGYERRSWRKSFLRVVWRRRSCSWVWGDEACGEEACRHGSWSSPAITQCSATAQQPKCGSVYSFVKLKLDRYMCCKPTGSFRELLRLEPVSSVAKKDRLIWFGDDRRKDSVELLEYCTKMEVDRTRCRDVRGRLGEMVSWMMWRVSSCPEGHTGPEWMLKESKGTTG